LGEERGRELRDELRWFGRQLGTARDLDVLIARLQNEVVELAGPDAIPAGKIVMQLEPGREAAQAERLAGLDSTRYAHLRSMLWEAVTAPAVATTDVSPTKVAQR